MVAFVLSGQERQALAELVAQSAFSNEARRAQALLWIDAGESPQVVAERLQTSRQTVYNWAARFKRRSGKSLQYRLADGKRSGRPATVAARIEPVLQQVIGQSPRQYGYARERWTVTLLGRYLREAHHVMTNYTSVSAALHRLGMNISTLPS